MKYIYSMTQFKPTQRGCMVSQAYKDDTRLMYTFYVARLVKGRLFVAHADIAMSAMEVWGGISDRFCQKHIRVEIERAASNVSQQIKNAR